METLKKQLVKRLIADNLHVQGNSTIWRKQNKKTVFGKWIFKEMSCHGVSSLERHSGWTKHQEIAQLFIPVDMFIDMLYLPLMEMHITNTLEEMGGQLWWGMLQSFTVCVM